MTLMDRIPSTAEVREAVVSALAEDLGEGDITAALVPETLQATATVTTREKAVVCGVPWFEMTFQAFDHEAKVEWTVKDGEEADAGQVLCTVSATAKALLSGERMALNFLQTLSGTATLARRYRERIAGLSVSLLDTRKTLPGLRVAQKYAVSCGGCSNHRLGLHDALLIKENHVIACGSISKAIEKANKMFPELPIEIEVEDLDQLGQALAAGAHVILLDNFDVDTLRQAVKLNQGRAKLEASGGITLDNVRQIAETGVDRISIGALTKDVKAVDLSMRLRIDR